MCGVTGIISNISTNTDIITSMTSLLSHRGPDFQSIWNDKNKKIFLGHSRLSILDLSKNGNQPMISSSGRYIITYNGEIYNHNLIRKKLNLSFWRGTSDTETILECFEKYGIYNTLQIIEGMFAFGIWDNQLKKLILARDRMGEKPLYYGLLNNNFVFSSELNPIIKNFKTNLKIDKSSVNIFLKKGYIPAPSSIFKNINKLKPGTYLEIFHNNLSDIKIYHFWNNKNKNFKAEVQKNINLNLNEIKKSTFSLLEKSVKHQMLSDAPLGAFLSSGVDSSIIVSIMQKNSLKKIQTFTVGFKDSNYDESNLAKKISLHLNTDHQEIFFNKSDLLSIVPNLHNIYDEPFADSSQIPTFLLCRLASKKVKVCLSGDGADELFGGYQRYSVIPELLKLSKIYKIPLKLFFLILRKRGITYLLNLVNCIAPRSFNFPIQEQKIDKLYQILKLKSNDNVYNHFMENFIKTDNLLIDSTISSNNLYIENSNITSQNLMLRDQEDYLPNDILCKIDRASMFNSLETRAPFLDHNLVDFANSLPINMKIKNRLNKIILREIQKDFLPNNLIHNKKIGFGIPIKKWLIDDLNEWVEETLNKKNIIDQGIFNYDIVMQRWNDLKKGNKNFSILIWHILTLQAWLNEYFS